MKRITIFLLLFLFGFIFINSSVKAAAYSGRFYEQGWKASKVGVFAKEKTGYMDYNGWFIKSTKDSNTYYCIDPATPLEGAKAKSHNLVTGKSNMIKNSKLTTSKYEKVNLLAYYGYGYKEGSINHTSKKWYGITQVMIWRVMRPNLSWTFKNSRYGTASGSLFKKEVKEMNTLLNNHKKKASFSGSNKKLKSGETITLTDNNKVLAYYNPTTTPKNVKLSKSGNSLKITGIKNGTETITFKRNSKVNNNFELFTSRTYQDIVKKGTFETISFSLKVEVTSNNINIQKEDSETGKTPHEGLNFKGAVYEVYDNSNKKIGQITTDANGKGSLVVQNGAYKLKEIKAPVGYKISDETYNVNINGKDESVRVKDSVIKGKLEINKEKGSKEEKYVKEKGAEFEIYDSKDKKIEKITTDENGTASIELSYGKYKIKQIKGTDGYAFVEDFEVDIKEEKNYTYNLKNDKESKLVFTKTDFSTEKHVPNTLIEIYTENDVLVFKDRTDQNGKIEIEKLKIGKYYILEKDAPKYYLLNEEKMPFEVKANGEVIKCNMENHRKEGYIKVIKKDLLEDMVLSGAKIEIIFDENGKKVYSGKTDQNGEIKTGKLIAGKYCVHEIEAPSGYKLDNKPVCIEIDKHEKIYEIVLKNKKNISIPDTFLNSDKKKMLVVGIIISLLGVTFILYGTIKSKKKD